MSEDEEAFSSPSSSDHDDEITNADHHLPNGDRYTGHWSSGCPQGTGKYVWTDSCIYEGEWRRGKTTGRGKFSWPSGATYDGEFKSGYMDGFGTYTGSSGETYRGMWSMNLRHGQGKIWYENGDCYDGEWSCGVQDGQGRYAWCNGTEYVGQWRNGTISGRGTIVWANGNQYEGLWENGMPKGNGSFRWSDGGVCDGVWGDNGVDSSSTERDAYEAFVAGIKDCEIATGEVVSVFPSQKILYGFKVDEGGNEGRRWSSVDGSRLPPKRPNGRLNTVIGENVAGERICMWEDGDISGDIVKGRNSASAAIGREGLEEMIGALRSEGGEGRSMLNRLQVGWPPRKPAKKQGETICKGHKNYPLMLNLQLGIRHAVGKQGPIMNLDLKASAFDPKEKVWSKFPPEGSKHTPPHNSCDFRWKDYCPLVFRTLRKLFKVDAADYMLSLCGNNALRELCSPGKSGSFFYLTHDDKYMIKTMKKSEVKVLLRMLPAYYNHFRSYENTLVTKFFGLHCVRLAGPNQKKVRFVIMGNLFCTEYAIHRRFDLKGSSHGRTTTKPESEIDENTTLKDLDLNFIFRLHKSWFQEFLRQVDRDCELLEQERIMDYSLLVGVHFRDSSSGDSETHLSVIENDQYLLDPNRWKLGISMPSRVELTTRRNDGELQLIGEPTGEFYEVILFFGIIDILQDYDISKKLEHAYKSFQYDPTSISAVDPRQYSRRFRDFIYKAFAEDT